MAMNAVEFIAALEEIEASKGISKDTILDMLQESLIKAYRKQLGGDDADVRVEIDPEKGIIDMCQVKAVVDEVEDDFLQISVQDANAEVSAIQAKAEKTAEVEEKYNNLKELQEIVDEQAAPFIEDESMYDPPLTELEDYYA